MLPVTTQFTGATIIAKANVYFDGGVISHTILLPGGEKRTLGQIRTGSYHFNTDAPERMEIIAGDCRVTVDGEAQARDFPAGTYFDVPGKSGFAIQVKAGICEYVCSFLA